MPRYSKAVAVIGSGLFISLLQSHALVAQTPAGGTYEISICRTVCDPRQPDAMVWGILVLEDRPFALSSLPYSARRYLEDASAYLLETLPDDEHDEEGRAESHNACFVLEATHNAPTYAGIERAAVTSWSRGGTGAIVMRFFQSPDAGYVAEFAVDGDVLKGTGESWSAWESGGVRNSYPNDFILGRRIGPADRARCVRGIETEAARRRRRLDAARRVPVRAAPEPPAAYRPSANPLATLLSQMLAANRLLHEVRGSGPWAFDPRILRVSRGPAPGMWPDSVALRWAGDVRDTAMPPGRVAALLAELNGGDGAHPNWMACGTGLGEKACTLANFPAVISFSEPWIQGDRAQVVVFVKSWGEFDFEPDAWDAAVIQLERTEGVWHPKGGYNWAGSWPN